MKDIITIDARVSEKTNKVYICAVYVPTGKIICFGEVNIHNLFGVKWSVLEQLLEDVFDGGKRGVIYTIA